MGAAMRRPFDSFVLALVLLSALQGCDNPSNKTAPAGGKASGAASALAAGEDDVLATVNGVPIRVPDLHYVLAKERGARAEGTDEQRAKATLEKIIDQELARQQAHAKGLDTDPDYLKKLRFMQAPLNDFERKELTDAFFHAEAAKVKVSDAEARKYFEDNRARFQTEVNVWQILIRNDEEKIRRLKEEIDGGTPFEKVAASLFPTDQPPGTRSPWDVGLLRWNQVPQPWVDALDKMKEGEVSGILHGPKNRTWIIKLNKRQQNESITFEQVRPDLIKVLQETKAAEATEKAAKALRSDSKIVYVRPPGAMPAPRDP